MYIRITCITLATIFQSMLACEYYQDPACLDVKPIDGDHFMNQYIVEIKGGEGRAKRVADDTGFIYKKPMKTHDDHYFFYHPDTPSRHKMRHEDILKILRDHEAVEVADQQFVWQPTIRELEEYEDMVGLEEPIEVRTSYFDPSEMVFEEKTAHELIRPDDVFREPEPIRDYPPLHTIVDFDKLYAEKNKEKEERARKRREEEESKKKQEIENKLKRKAEAEEMEKQEAEEIKKEEIEKVNKKQKIMQPNQQHKLENYVDEKHETENFFHKTQTSNFNEDQATNMKNASDEKFKKNDEEKNIVKNVENSDEIIIEDERD